MSNKIKGNNNHSRNILHFEKYLYLNVFHLLPIYGHQAYVDRSDIGLLIGFGSYSPEEALESLTANSP